MIQQELLKHLQQFVTEDKLRRIDYVIKDRTRHLTIVLEDIYQPHNASAVLRSCECFGIQDLHVIEQEKQYKPNPEIALGASQWLTIHRHKETQSC